MVSRRDFLKRAALATAGSALAVSNADAISNIAAPIIGAKKNVNINRKGKGGKMTLKFFPYELKLQHVFTVATYTLETVMGQDDDWDPTAATEQASAPTNVKLSGTTLAWDNNDYALLWAVCKNGKVVDFTIKPTYLVDDASATWSIRAANEMGGLSEATAAVLGTGIKNIASATDAAVIKTIIFAADGTQLSNLQKGINIVVKTLADGSKKTSKVIVK
mgnify:CR=1 FL=1